MASRAGREGQQLGNYRLVRLLGRGGFAEVYLGKHVHLDTLAAVKVLHTQLSQTDVERFRNEARTLVHLIHPNIVRVLDYGVEGNTPFLVMDYAPNGSLRQHHPKGLPLPLTTIVHYVNSAAKALQYAHDAKLVHRDVKPENMLLGRDEELLLSDFGIALVAQTTYYSSRQEMAGTIAYMAPEQIQAQPLPASDQYALGIVIYEWLSGEHPFTGSFAEIAAKHAFIPPPPLREKDLEISPAVEEVVRIALEKNPYKRFGSVRAFAHALEQASKPGEFDLSGDDGPPTLVSRAISPLSQKSRAMPSDQLQQLEQLTGIDIAILPKKSIPPMSHVPETPHSYSTIFTPQTGMQGRSGGPLPARNRAIQEQDSPVQDHTSHREASHFYSTIETPQSFSHGNPVGQGTHKDHRFARRRFPNIFIGSLLALLVIICVVALLDYTQKIPPIFGFGATTIQTLYPNIAGNYSGPIHNTRANIFAPMKLSLKQKQGSISGTFDVGNPLKGNGAFTGTIDTAKHIRFLVRSDTSGQTSAPILFWGAVQPDGSLSGNYCSVNKLGRCGDGGYGVWNVARLPHS